MLNKILHFLCILLFITSCNPDNEISEIVDLSANELNSIFSTDSTLGIADDILSSLFISKSYTNKNEPNLNCYKVEYSTLGFTVNFNNCTLKGITNVNGIIRVVYNTDSTSSSFRVIYNDFNVGNHILNGTRTISTIRNTTKENSITYSITNDILMLLNNEEEVYEIGTKTFKYSLDNNLKIASYELTGNWKLKLEQNTYDIIIKTPLVNSTDCLHSTEGIISVNKNGFTVLVDMGDGSCDDMATINYPNGSQESIKFGQ